MSSNDSTTQVVNYTAAAGHFYRLVRNYAIKASNGISDSPTYYTTKPDEVHDITKISQRVYGVRHEVVAVMAVLGLSRVDRPIPIVVGAYPPQEVLELFKRASKYESDPDLIESDTLPTWDY